MGLAQLVIDAARRRPEASAVVGPDERLSYAELDARADRLAASLARLGVGPGDRVALWLPKSARAVVAMQACLRLGAVYLPVDPEGPARRARKLILDAGARCLICTDDRPDPMAGDDPALARIGSTAAGALRWAEALAENVEPLAEPATVDAEDLAYILYTSGSTGTPKGVAISHRAALAFVRWAVEQFEIGPDDRLANHAAFHFDLSVLDLYAAFAAGARVCLIPEQLGPGEHVEFIREQHISVWYSVPSVLILMMDHGGLLELEAEAHPRLVLFAGEPFPIKHLRRLRAALPAARLFNLYGPTETNVCTVHEVGEIAAERSKPVPIGRPCCGDEAWAETEDGRRAAPGESGELMVRGPTTMTGYWGRPPLGDAPYPTGDIVRVLDDGAFEYQGRRDHMVKVRGMRIEIGEVEAALLEHPAIHQCAVIVAGAGLDARLLAFVRLEPGASRPSMLHIKRHCAERLPRYMVVDKLVVLDELPRTRNAKIDRRALAQLATEGPAHAGK